MLRKFREAREEEGFTLIELLVVVIIIGILAAIAIPVFLNQRKKAWDAAAKSDVKNMVTAEESWLTEPTSTTYTNDVANLIAQGFKKTDDANLTHGACVYASVTGGATDAFVVGAKHAQSTNTWYYDSQDGVVTNATTGLGCTPTLG